MQGHFLQLPSYSRQLPGYVPSDITNMEDQYSKKFSTWSANSLQVQTQSSEYKKESAARLSVSSVLPGTGNVTHNVTRMLGDSSVTSGKMPTNNLRASPYSLHRSDQCMPFIDTYLLQNSTLNDSDLSQENSTRDISASDMSMSSERSVSPYSSSITPPPTANISVLPLTVTPPSVDASLLDNSASSGASSPSDEYSLRSASTPELPCTDQDKSKGQTGGQSKKKARTNFTNEQIKSLLKIFYETPYPESEMMENIAKDLNIKEKQVKIWFQNKRARSRRRINDSSHYQTAPMPFGYMPPGHMMTSSPLQNFPFNYHMMQGYFGQYNNQHLIGQMLTNQNHRNFQTANQCLASMNHATSALSAGPRVPSMSSAQYGMTLPQQNSPNRQLLQYPGYMYASK